MKLDRNINANGRGKYALLKLRKLDEFTSPNDPFQSLAKQIADAIKTLEEAGILDWGNTQDSEFFVIRLKDRYARAGLRSYATEALLDGNDEYANEVFELANCAGPHHPNCKVPD